MPIDRLVLIIVIVMAAAAATVYVGMILLASSQFPPLILVAGPVLALLAYIATRVLRDRLNSAEDDHYDRIE
ncbi:hypothetical protein [Pontivivens insulae]|uniref:Uncharacterized protein n=1 Tax=Pontivivens insulae TaxID=1639689 RepID=A0A2R8ABU3_9RHOB|nr:hypothetical protein [Pontivivens insulae]RED11297.1 hypothetical protein DFR53_3332 [Pontivivens insulae]SPF29530.1 hypothetical protein POI8812_01841 [Pontivivens insulae]